ncbi:hypothetical protein ACFWWS_38875 [Streptomyces sp. NPDC059083]|uniref:hypothetical protein n=1 Tax=Streptomyces sp. NPDC059083 TaxID=3346721 RepID=UPI0036D12E1F
MTNSASPQSVQLPVRHTRAKSEKRSFSTQLRRDTLLRLDWVMKHGFVLTETVDAAVNAYLDAAGVPYPGMDGAMPPDF